jgi:2-amino-4-hydroxy-6-hydroxymethyldihydropteridine diphosphokinase
MKQKDFLAALDREQIVDAISTAERMTSGEIRVHIQPKTYGEIRVVAERTFERLGMTKTKERNGVLLFIACEDQRFVILGDSGIDGASARRSGTTSPRTCTIVFSAARLTAGIVDAIHSAGRELKTLPEGARMTPTSSRTKSMSSSDFTHAPHRDHRARLEPRRPRIQPPPRDRALPIRVVRVSEFLETEPVDAPPPMFLNAVVVGHTNLGPQALLHELLALETRLGRRRRGIRNEPRVIDLDLIAYGATRMRTPELTLPHPRAREREFVMKPLSAVSVFRLQR